MADSFPYDAAYKAIFREEQLFRSLLLNFLIPGLAERDIANLSIVSSQMETEELKRRMADLIWHAEFTGQRGGLDIILEFQRDRDAAMANRMAVYSHLRTAEVLQEGKKPPRVLPVVMYLGDGPWNCALDAGALYAKPPTPLPVAPVCHEYLLLDVQRMDRDALARSAAPAAFIFRMEQARSIDEALTATQDLAARLPGPEYGRLRRIVRNMLYCYVERGGWDEDFNKILSAEEFRHMIEKFRKAEEEKADKLLREGESRGIIIGERRGFAAGERRGFAAGERRGFAAGDGLRLAAQLAGLRDIIAARYGSVPESWEPLIARVEDAQAINGLLLSIVNGASRQDLEARLLLAAKADKA